MQLASQQTSATRRNSPLADSVSLTNWDGANWELRQTGTPYGTWPSAAFSAVVAGYRGHMLVSLPEHSLQ
jgi:hypothetical protein